MALDRSRVLELLGDVPQSIESRALLLTRKRCRIVGVDPSNCVVVDPSIGLAAMIGAPEPVLVRESLGQCGPGATLLVAERQLAVAREAAREWTWQEANRLVHTSRAPRRRSASLRTGLLDQARIRGLSNWPESVVREIASRQLESDVSACWLGSRMVSICCAAWETERFWDVFVYTREGYRSMGCGAAAVDLLIRRFEDRGKRAVWFAHSGNPQSLALARKLGFRFEERLYVFSWENPA